MRDDGRPADMFSWTRPWVPYGDDPFVWHDPSEDFPAARAPASAQTRAAYDRMDALSRSVFWANEQEIDPADPVAGVKLAQALRELGRYDQAADRTRVGFAALPLEGSR